MIELKLPSGSSKLYMIFVCLLAINILLSIWFPINVCKEQYNVLLRISFQVHVCYGETHVKLTTRTSTCVGAPDLLGSKICYFYFILLRSLWLEIAAPLGLVLEHCIFLLCTFSHCNGNCFMIFCPCHNPGLQTYQIINQSWNTWFGV